MKKIFLLLFFVSSVTIVNSQTDLGKLSKSATSGQANIGSLLSQLGKGITPASFGDGWAGLKSGWFKDAGKVTETTGAIKSLQTLTNNLKPSAFTAEFAKTKADWLKNLGAAKSLKSIGDLTSKLVNGLNPSALTKEFSAGKSGYLSALKLLK